MYCGLLKGTSDRQQIYPTVHSHRDSRGGEVDEGIHVSQGTGSQGSLIKYLHQTQGSWSFSLVHFPYYSEITSLPIIFVKREINKPSFSDLG